MLGVDRPVRLLVCGGRDFTDQAWVNRILDTWLGIFGAANLILIEGGATGADAFARHWAKVNVVRCETFRANWSRFGNRAGPLRNTEMLVNGKPDFLLAFPGGTGTADMVAKARKAGVLIAEESL